MNFLNPLFLFGLAAAAIPILIHLFTRKRPREVQFSSLEFLSEVNRSEIRRIQLKQWLLLLLRTLAVIALALAMSRPVIKASAGSKDGAATTIVALIDKSGSMGALTRTGPVMNEARRLVESLLATLGHGDEMLLIPYDEGPAPISARPISDVPRLRAATQGLSAGARATDHRRALALAAEALRESHALNRELFWVSDFQSSGFEGAAAGLPPGPWGDIRSYLVPLSPARRGNVALIDAALAPAESGAALAVRGASFAAPAGDRAVAVAEVGSGDELGRGFLPVSQSGEADALIPLSRLPGQGGRVTLPDDDLPLDNVRVFAAGRSGTLRVLLRHEGAATPLGFALAAGSPASGLVVESVDAATVPARLADADVLVLDDLERMGPAELQATLDFMRGGGALMLVLGRRADPRFWNGALLRDLGIGVLEDLEQAQAGSGWRLRRRVAGHPVLVGFPARPGEPLSTARFTTIRRLIPGSGARVLLEFDREHPALVESRAALAFLAPLDAESSDFPISGAFLPLLHQAVKVLGRGTAAASLVPGERYTAPAGTGAWRIADEAGRDVPVQLVTAEGATRLLSAPLERPGLYRVFQGAAPRASFAVNPDRRESDLSSIPEATLTNWFPAGRVTVLRPGGDLERRVREARYGRELWTWFVILALACLLAETFLGRWGMPGVGREPRPAS
ncbi:MAG TPA: BatA domain-containing protein [Candidatus Eisenbacteria bacterium]|nr:BatA domain-containing protein [Candidatus Eisenbacteria bacterium]